MSSAQQRQLSLYRYDPLNRLIHQTQANTPELQRFYCKNRLATEIQGALSFSIVQYGDQLLGQQQSEGNASDTTLMATDQQRSILHTLQANHQRKPICYSPYGHRPVASGLLSLLGFNGERPDPVTGHYLLGNGYRAFNPVLLRFNSPDSWSPFGRGGLNSYAYCLGDPINRYDPTGHVTDFIKAGLLRWRERARLNSNVKFEDGVLRSLMAGEAIGIDDGYYSLRPGRTPVDGVKAYRRVERLRILAATDSDANGKFSEDLSRMTRESKLFGELTQQPAQMYPPLKVLKYIERRPGEDLSMLFSKVRLYRATQGKFDSEDLLYLRPSVDESRRYREQMNNASNRDHLMAAADKIRDVNFTKVGSPSRK